MEVDEDRFDRQKRIPNWNQAEVDKQNALVIGAGALGNEVVKLLLQLGVGKIRVVDFDTIVPANLNRTVFFSQTDANAHSFKADVLARESKKINPNVQVTPDTRAIDKVEEKFFTESTIVFGCLDNLGARLFSNANAYGKAPFVDGGTTGFFGKIHVTNAPSSCFECSLSQRDYKHLWQRYSCVGELLDIQDPKTPALPTTTSIIAAFQVNEFLKMLHGMDNLAGKYLHYDGLRQEAKIFDVPLRKDCPIHVK